MIQHNFLLPSFQFIFFIKSSATNYVNKMFFNDLVYKFLKLKLLLWGLFLIKIKK